MATITTQQIANHAADLAVDLGMQGAFGFLGAHLVDMNPATGFAFGIVTALVSKLTRLVTNALFFTPGANSNLRFIGHVLNFVIPIALSISICTALGFPMTLYEFAVLAVGSAVALLATKVIMEGLGISTQ